MYQRSDKNQIEADKKRIFPTQFVSGLYPISIFFLSVILSRAVFLAEGIGEAKALLPGRALSSFSSQGYFLEVGQTG